MVELRAIVVDDESPSREEIIFLLKQEGVTVVKSYASGLQMLADYQNHDFNLLFLDIRMPDMTGFELAAQLQSKQSFSVPIVFATAYDKYALDAFDINAMDYILKPISEKRLQQTLSNVRKRLAPHDDGPALNIPTATSSGKEESNALSKITKSLIVAEKNGRVVLVEIKNIIYVSTEYTGTYIVTYDDRLFTHMTLKELEERLAPYSFFRTHRSYLVNFNYVAELLASLSGTYTLRLKDKNQTEIPVSRIQTRRLKKIFNI